MLFRLLRGETHTFHIVNYRKVPNNGIIITIFETLTTEIKLFEHILLEKVFKISEPKPYLARHVTITDKSVRHTPLVYTYYLCSSWLAVHRSVHFWID